MKKTIILIWTLAGLLLSFALGTIAGTNTGRKAGLSQAIQNIEYCEKNGASGYYNTDIQIRCLYD